MDFIRLDYLQEIPWWRMFAAGIVTGGLTFCLFYYIGRHWF